MSETLLSGSKLSMNFPGLANVKDFNSLATLYNRKKNSM
jgi:hypothetical protein